MKYFFYTLLLFASLGTIGAVMNPSLAKKYAALAGLEFLANSADSVENAPDEDQLAKFLAQYPFANHQNESPPHTEKNPSLAIPEPVIPPIPPAAVPVAEQIPPLPAPPIADAVPTASNWDGTAATPVAPPVAVPVYAAPVADNYFSSDVVTEPIQVPTNYQVEPTPAPQQSVYAAAIPPNPAPNNPAPFAPDPFAAPANVAVNTPTGFEPLKYSPPQNALPIQSPIPPLAPTLQTPTVLIEDVPCYGMEMVARVGTQVILMCDILPKLRRAAMQIVTENIKRIPEEDRAKVQPGEIEQVVNAFTASKYPEFLQQQILVALIYNDYSLAKSKAERDFLNERLGEDFERTEVPELMKEFGVNDMVSLKKYLKDQLGSSLEREKNLWAQEKIAQQWVSGSVQRASGECTHDEMLEYYEKNLSMFTSQAKARWQEMTVLFSKHNSEQEAMNKIGWMGNQVANGAPFDEIAKANSDGFTASKGGVWDWTAKGSLSSAELEQAIFLQPIGSLSPAIIRTEKGLHLVKVLERNESKITPFVEAQVTIRERIRNQRSQHYQEEYFTELRRRFPTVVIRDQINFDINARSPNTIQR